MWVQTLVRGTKIWLACCTEIKKKKEKGMRSSMWGSWNMTDVLMRGGRSREDTDLGGEPRDDKSERGAQTQLHNRVAEDGKQPWTPAAGRECSAQSHPGGVKTPDNAWTSTSGLQHGEKRHFCGSSSPRSVLLESINLEKPIHFLSIFQTHSPFLSASTCLVPPLRLFPTLAFQA